MNHLTEETVILAYYREAIGEAAQAHLASCSACREELRNISHTLDAFHQYPVPEPPPAFEQLLWQRISPALRSAIVPRRWWQSWALAPGLACLLVVSFFVGRWSMDRPRGRQLAGGITDLAGGISDSGRERILLVALGDHLERSQMVLVEIANSKPGSASAFHLAQQRAQDLVGENRLYRQTALLSGDTEFADLLDELERVLTDIANRPSDLSSPELEQIQRRIESRGLIFKIRVTGSNLQQKGSEKL
jgi:hypothetical protein